jgi:probable HAF family extracellular repeat protein
MLKIIVLCLSGAAALGQVEFRGLGDLPGGGTYSEAWGLSPDGLTAVGASVVNGGGLGAVLDGFTWTNDFGLLPVFGTTAGVSVVAHDVSASGAIVGSADFGPFSPLGRQAYIWTSATGPVFIGDLPGGCAPAATARCITPDGTHIAGIGDSNLGAQAWVLDVPSGQLTALIDFPGGSLACYAYGISDDGRVVIGRGTIEQGLQAMRWRDGTPLGLGYLPTLPGNLPTSSAEAVSADGSVVVGWSRSVNSPNGAEAFRWTPQGGMEALGDLPEGPFQSWAYGVSADGNIVVGRATIQGPCGIFGCGGEGRAFIWDRASGMRNLSDVLIQGGANLTGWKLIEARAISADGLTVVGNGINPLGQNEAWLARLGATCIGDFTGDGGVDSDDVIAFFTAWDASLPLADVSRDGGVDSDDVILFFSHWDAGC